MTGIEIRPTQPQERRAAADTFRGALLHGPTADADWEMPWMSASWEEGTSLSAWDGDRCVGHAGAFDFLTAVPGGSLVPTAGVTRVGVRPTHTRRGLLTQMMTELLLDAAAQGKALASLRASEARIYGRFGYAVAGEAWDVEIDVHRGVRVVAPVAPGSIRLLHHDEVMATIPPLHDRIGLDRPGALVRPGWMHTRFLGDAASGTKSTFVIVHTAPDGTDDGWAQYSTGGGPEFGQPEGSTCTVHDLWGASHAVELALWRFVLDLDLIDRVRAQERPTDDVVRFALNDVRYYKSIARFDEQWVRLLDVDAALQTRTYNPFSAAVTIAVTDPLVSGGSRPVDNTGTWRVTGGGVERVSSQALDSADLVSTIAGVSGAYLGGTAWWEMAVAGHVRENRPGALAEADALFVSRPLPRCGSFF